MKFEWKHKDLFEKMHLKMSSTESGSFCLGTIGLCEYTEACVMIWGSRYLRQWQVITSHSKLWSVITYHCLRCLLLASKSSYDVKERWHQLVEVMVIGSGYGLSPVRLQAITWTDEILANIYKFSFKKCVWFRGAIFHVHSRNVNICPPRNSFWHIIALTRWPTSFANGIFMTIFL